MQELELKMAPCDTFRAFLAIELPEKEQEIVHKLIQSLSKHNNYQKIRWSKKENLHITLCFLGEITEQQYQELNTRIEKIIKNFSAFNLELTQAELFPSPKHPIALVLKPQINDTIMELAGAMKEEAIASGINLEKRRFKPHLTIGKIARNANIAVNTIPASKIPALKFAVTEVKLYESVLKKDGSVYNARVKYDI